MIEKVWIIKQGWMAVLSFYRIITAAAQCEESAACEN